MPYTFDEITLDVVLPVGDTMQFCVNVANDAYHVVIFAIYDRNDGADILRVPVEIVDGAANIRLTSAHTRDLPAGRYKWNLRLVSDPEYDENGNVIVEDESDNVVTVFGPENDAIPNIKLVKNGGRV